MEILRPKVYHRKSAFFEMTKNWKSAGGVRNRPAGFWIVLEHHNRNIWHLSTTKSCSIHRFWKNISDWQRGGVISGQHGIALVRHVFEVESNIRKKKFSHTNIWRSVGRWARTKKVKKKLKKNRAVVLSKEGVGRGCSEFS